MHPETEGSITMSQLNLAQSGAAQSISSPQLSIQLSEIPALYLILGAMALCSAVPAALYFAIGGYMAYRLSHPPRQPLERTPALYGLAFENVTFRSEVDHIALRGWYIDTPGERVILMLHGLGGNRAYETDMRIARALALHNYDVMMFDFRGHGESGDAPISVGEHEVRDVAGAIRYLKTRRVQKVGVLGMSLGAVTALNAAAEQPEMRALVLDSPFADASALLQVEMPKGSGLPAWFNPGILLMGKLLYNIHLDENKPVRSMARLGTRPVLYIHGSEDDTIPLTQAMMFKQAGAQNPNMEQWIVQGAGHTSTFTFNPAAYEARVLAFFDKYLGEK